jgi:hypothetical protein
MGSYAVKGALPSGDALRSARIFQQQSVSASRVWRMVNIRPAEEMVVTLRSASVMRVLYWFICCA